MNEQMLDEGIRAQVQEIFKSLVEPVEILFFGSQKGDCILCAETLQLLSEVSSLSEKLVLREMDLHQDAEQAQQLGVDKAPAFVLARVHEGKPVDQGVRFAGIPSGHEFTTLINDLLLVSKGDSALSPETRQFLAGLKEPLHLQVFVTPT